MISLPRARCGLCHDAPPPSDRALQLPITCEQLADVNFDVEYRLKWDSYAKEIRVVEALDDAVPQDMVYWLVAFPWPMSNRDYVFLRHRQQTAEGHHVLISKGITSARVAEVSGVVRVEQLRTFFAIRPATNGAHCEFALLYFDGAERFFVCCAPLTQSAKTSKAPFRVPL